MEEQSEAKKRCEELKQAAMEAIEEQAEAKKRVEEVRRSSIELGTSIWNASGQRASNSSEAFRVFTKREMQEVRGSMAAEVQKDLRAVHWRYGFDPHAWESEAMKRERSVGAVSVPERQTKNLQKTQFKLGDVGVDYISNSKDAHQKFSKSETDSAQGVMSEQVRKDLRAVHVFAPYDKQEWKSEAMSMAKNIKSQKPPERLSKDFFSSHIHFGHERLGYTSDSKSSLREFSKQEMADVRGAMSKEAKQDLRAVHFKLGHDRGVLDRDIRDRAKNGPIRCQRPQSAPSRARP